MDLQRLKIDRGPRPAKSGVTSGKAPGSAPPPPPPAPRRRKSVLARHSGLLVALGLIALGLWIFGGTLMRAVDRLRLPEVETVRVTLQTLASAGSSGGAAANGYVVARTRAALSADTPGRIVEMNVREGQAVEKGFVVARLYAEEYAAEVRRTEADLAVGKAEVARHAAEVDEAAADIARLEAAVREADARVLEAQATERLAQLRLARTEDLVKDDMESTEQLDVDRSEFDAARANVASTKAAAAAARAALDQGRSRHDVAKAMLEWAQARIGSLEAARDLAQATLDKTAVRAPFDGIVVLKDAEVGEVVSPNSQAGGSARGAVVTMVDFDSLEVQAEVPETNLEAVRVGEPARIFLDAYPDHPYEGRVDRIWPTANRQKATVEVRVTFDRTDDLLRPEMGARVVFLGDVDGAGAAGAADPAGQAGATVAGGKVLLIPEEAVVRSAGRTYAFVVERDTVRMREIAIEPWRAGRVLVAEGLAEDERIVVEPPHTLEDGDRIRMKEAR